MIDGPTFRATDGTLWRWNSFRSELQQVREPPTETCGNISCVNGCDGAPDFCEAASEQTAGGAE